MAKLSMQSSPELSPNGSDKPASQFENRYAEELYSDLETPLDSFSVHSPNDSDDISEFEGTPYNRRILGGSSHKPVISSSLNPKSRFLNSSPYGALEMEKENSSPLNGYGRTNNYQRDTTDSPSPVKKSLFGPARRAAESIVTVFQPDKQRSETPEFDINPAMLSRMMRTPPMYSSKKKSVRISPEKPTVHKYPLGSSLLRKNQLALPSSSSTSKIDISDGPKVSYKSPSKTQLIKHVLSAASSGNYDSARNRPASNEGWEDMDGQYRTSGDYANGNSNSSSSSYTQRAPLTRNPFWDPVTPYVLSGYMQIIFNFMFMASIIYMIYLFVSTVRHDVDMKVEEYSLEILAEMSECSKNYIQNNCMPDKRVPALEKLCNSWERCMNRDPQVVGRARVGAETFGEIIHSFLKPISWKSLIVILIFVLSTGTMSNMVMTYTRANLKPNSEAKSHPSPSSTPSSNAYSPRTPASGTRRSQWKTPGTARFYTPGSGLKSRRR
ncbi:hypothetical protein TRVA0_004S02344 [Trichomonascus vanleenenianus]|uniref:Brr6/Brl1 family protein n=1 Tax=Trichomonascus vanleenenianus TaxID=2268995 RepID=UPI003ECADF49